MLINLSFLKLFQYFIFRDMSEFEWENIILKIIYASWRQ